MKKKTKIRKKLPPWHNKFKQWLLFDRCDTAEDFERWQNKGYSMGWLTSKLDYKGIDKQKQKVIKVKVRKVERPDFVFILHPNELDSIKSFDEISFARWRNFETGEEGFFTFII